MPSITSSDAPGMCCAVSRPAARGTSGSLAPWITSVGAAMVRSSLRRSPEATTASNWRRVPAGSDHAEHPDQVIDHRLGIRRVGGPAQQRLARPAARPRDAPVAARGHDRSEAKHALREARRQHLRDHAAHRGADDVRAHDSQAVQQADGIAGHVFQRIGRAHRQAERRGSHGQQQVAALASRRAPRKAAIAIVEAHDAVAARHQAAAEVVRPARQLHAQPHDEQDGRLPRVAERLVFDVRFSLGAWRCGRHGVTPPPRGYATCGAGRAFWPRRLCGAPCSLRTAAACAAQRGAPATDIPGSCRAGTARRPRDRAAARSRR